MRIDNIKRIVRSNLPESIVGMLQSLWQSGRVLLNDGYFTFRHRQVILIKAATVVYGQYNQPIIADTILKSRRDGFFLDIGANHPVNNSNSHFFESQRNYRGIALDPLGKYENLWSELRPRSRFMNVAAGSAEGQIEFFEHENTDGWADQLSYTADSKLNDGRTKGRSVTRIRIDSIPDLPTPIDVVSLDVEGAEAEVLQGFGTLRPTVLIVENCFGIAGNEALRAQIAAMGYRQVARVSYIDDIFVRNDFDVDRQALRRLSKLHHGMFA